MTNQDIELQTIREKLQRVQQTPLSADATALPWATASRKRSATADSGISINPHLHQYAATVETLKQRSHQHLHTFAPDQQQSLSPSAVDHGAVSHGAVQEGVDRAQFTHARESQSVESQSVESQSGESQSGESQSVGSQSGEGQESQFDEGQESQSWPSPEVQSLFLALAEQAEQINQWSDQQAAAMLTMRSLAEQLAIAGYAPTDWDSPPRQEGDRPAWDRDGEEGMELPCHFQAALVPTVTQTAQGTYIVDYRSVDLYQEYRHAYEVAGDLRNRHHRHTETVLDLPLFRWNAVHHWLKTMVIVPFNHRVASVVAPVAESVVGRLSQQRASLSGVSERGSRYPQGRNRGRRPDPPTRSRLTAMDGLIWFSGAAIVRICIGLWVAKQPAVFPYLALLFLGVGLVVLYRATLTHRPNYTLGFRLLIAIVGFIVGGRF